MKKPFLITASAIFISAIAFSGYLSWAKVSFASREIKRLTGANEVHVLDEMHAEDQWYAKAEIDENTGKNLLASHKWKPGFEKNVALAGRIVSGRLLDCSTCFYRIEQSPHDRQFHSYNYTAYVLSPDLKVLEVYEAFGS